MKLKYEIKVDKEPQTKLLKMKCEKTGESVWFFELEFSKPFTKVIVGEHANTTEEALGISFGFEHLAYTAINTKIIGGGTIVFPNFFEYIETPRDLTQVCVTFTDQLKYRFLCFRGNKSREKVLDYEDVLVKLKAI